LNRHLGSKEQPRRILKSLEGAKYIEMPGADRCCGMGGQFSMLNYELSQKIGQKKIESIESTEADIVVTACPGCQFQLLDGIVRLKKPQKVMSLMEVLG
jgi:glycolate oxidase iron-sulfur subunit